RPSTWQWTCRGTPAAARWCSAPRSRPTRRWPGCWRPGDCGRRSAPSPAPPTSRWWPTSLKRRSPAQPPRLDAAPIGAAPCAGAGSDPGLPGTIRPFTDEDLRMRFDLRTLGLLIGFALISTPARAEPIEWSYTSSLTAASDPAMPWVYVGDGGI